MADRSRFGAVVLASTLEATPVPELIIEAHLAVPPVYRAIRSVRSPLDLEADVHRYRVGGSDIVAVRTRRGARTCRERNHRPA